MIVTEILWKSTAVLLAAFAANALMRRSSAAIKHFLWASAFAALLAMPLASLVMPKWSVTQPAMSLPAATAVSAPAGSSSTSPSTSSQVPWLTVVWFSGVVAAAVRFVIAAVRTFLMLRRATEGPAAHDLCGMLGIRRRVRILTCADAPMPMTWGIFRPVVALPADAAEWPAERLHTVLLHELIHVRRFDLVAQALAQAACCLYWFHPLAWLGLRQLRDERERACDDAVLMQGVPPHEYAAQLLDMVRGLRVRRSPLAGAAAMAESSGFESRIRALLDGGRRRQPLSYAGAVAIVAVMAAVLLPLAAVTAHAQSSRGTLAGVVQDPSGARIPKCEVSARNLDGANQEITTCSADGEYRFASIPSGRYALEFRAPGFAFGKFEVSLVSGAVARVDATVEVGRISERVKIAGGAKPAPSSVAEPARTPQRVRIGGNVKPSRLLRQPRAVYPPELKQLGVEGTVVITAVISKDGTVLNPKVANTVDARFAQAALDAVRQWQYEPTLLNGEPVEVLTTVTLEFSLSQ